MSTPTSDTNPYPAVCGRALGTAFPSTRPPTGSPGGSAAPTVYDCTTHTRRSLHMGARQDNDPPGRMRRCRMHSTGACRTFVVTTRGGSCRCLMPRHRGRSFCAFGCCTVSTIFHAVMLWAQCCRLHVELDACAVSHERAQTPPHVRAHTRKYTRTAQACVRAFVRVCPDTHNSTHACGNAHAHKQMYT